MAAGILLAAGSNAGTGQTGREKALTSLIDAERAFSRTSEAKGIREAFLTWLAPDAIVFRPGPVEGRPVYEKMSPDNPAVLTWEPEIAEVAASGELGYTSGPYQVRPGRGTDPTGFGHYISVWKKQTDGTWKVLLDIGVQHGRPASLNPVETVVTPAAEAGIRPLSPEVLRDEERAFGVRAGSFENEAGKKGLRKALASFSTDDIRVIRPGEFPTVGMRAANGLIPAGAGRPPASSKRRSTNYQVGLAWSGDLAYCYGTSKSGKGGGKDDTTAYLRIWRKDGSGTWRICADIALPVPSDAGKKN
jgi:ketosteroid isomerase-like protein